jgi:hypothetical protein
MSMKNDPRPSVRAIANEDSEGMQQCVYVYRNPSTTFEVESRGGERCIVTPFGLAVEVCGDGFERVLDALVSSAGLDPNKEYELVNHEWGMRIRTNPLSHLLASWRFWRSELLRDRMLSQLITAGANAAAPALFEVTPLQCERKIPLHWLQFSKASGQSLIAFQMTQWLDIHNPFNFIAEAIARCGARCGPEDPAGLFVRYALSSGQHGRRILSLAMDFLCPLVKGPPKIAPGGEDTELRRIVRGIDPESGMNLLHMYVERGGEHTAALVIERLRMLRNVYGLSLLTPTLDGRRVTALAAAQMWRRTYQLDSDEWARHMLEAVATVMEDELLLRHRALALAQGLRGFPCLVMYEIGRYAGLPIQGAHTLDKGVLEQRRRS